MSASPLARIRDAVQAMTQFNEEDMRAVDFLCAMFVANLGFQTYERVWAYLVGPPSTGKTMLMNALFRDWDAYVYFTDSLTPKSFLSAFGKNAGEDHSLLKKIHNKILMLPDFSTIAKMDPVQSNAIMGQLRASFDGEESGRETGLGGVHHKARFGVLAATTDHIDDFIVRQAALGERSVFLRMGESDALATPAARDCKTRWAAMATADKNKHRQAVHTAAKMMDPLIKCLRGETGFEEILPPNFVEPEIPPDLLDRLIVYADMTARVRTPPPERGTRLPEGAPRLVQQLKHLACARCLVDARSVLDESDLDFIKVIARDSIHPDLLSALRVFWGGSRGAAYRVQTLESLEGGTRLPQYRLKALLRHWTYMKLIRAKEGNRYRLHKDEADRLHRTGFLN